MIQAYDDEDNAPMAMDMPLPYPVRTWEEMQKEVIDREGNTERHPQEWERSDKG